MCVEISNNFDNEIKNMKSQTTTPTKKPTYSIKKLFKQIFKARNSCHSIINTQQQFVETLKQVPSMESLESIDNQLNADIESHCSLESLENDANERISISNCDFVDINTVPVHFVRTEHGTFFWTAAAEIPADNDLIEPLCCNTSNQIAIAAVDRWAQA